MKQKRKTELPITSRNRTTHSLALSSLSSSVWSSISPSCSFFPVVTKVFMFLSSKQRKVFTFQSCLPYFCAARMKQSLNLRGFLFGCFPVINSSVFGLILFFSVPFYWQSLIFQHFCFNLIVKSQIDRVVLICVC